MVVEACAKAASGFQNEEEELEYEGQDDSGAVDQVTSQVHTILATAAVCYGVHLVDCYVVKLYRMLKKWEFGMTHEEKGNLLFLTFVTSLFSIWKYFRVCTLVTFTLLKP